ncbi:hypothetical protein Tco_0877160 [Tanacetum coccineum]|uniref:Retrovirus-related Pol polyprotein from transposon TNT 1-94-like beta-barrel domain-containing protein n=1 Tax=Tanacetum coccineum TaxID=301880 RepID=A0ABQ5BW34_9ASTR
MKSYGDHINEEAVVSKFLRSLNSKFNHVVAAIEEAHDLSSYSFDELMSSLLTHEGTPHKNKRGESIPKVEAEEEVNLMKDKIGTPFNGEIATSMATKMLIAGANRKVVPYTVNTARSMDIEMLIVGANRKASNTMPILAKLQRRDYLRPILVNVSNKENNVWYIDSGCTNHMCGARSMFKELDESPSSLKLSVTNPHVVSNRDFYSRHDPYYHIACFACLPDVLLLLRRSAMGPVVLLLGVLCLSGGLHEECQFPFTEKVVVSGKNGDDGDLLLFQDGPGACDMSAGALRLFISWEYSRPVAGVKVSPSSGVSLSFSYHEFVVYASR